MRSSEIIQDVTSCSWWWNAFDIDARFNYRKFANCFDIVSKSYIHTCIYKSYRI